MKPSQTPAHRGRLPLNQPMQPLCMYLLVPPHMAVRPFTLLPHCDLLTKDDKEDGWNFVKKKGAFLESIL